MDMEKVAVVDITGFSATQFEQFESKCMPVLIKGLVKNWEAIDKWSGRQGNEHLCRTAGDQNVKVMCSTNEVFFGAMHLHQPLACKLKDFLKSETQERWQSTGLHTYLAQLPVHRGLLEDVPLPEVFSNQCITQTNMWISASQSRSSPHYDPYQNLLCVVTGEKIVKLYRPDLTPGFYPFPVWSESANHSGVDFVNPNFKQHPEYREALKHELCIHLKPGDALFIPEGWWHQVDSREHTIAVNFWWRSKFFHSLSDHMAAYYLRQILRKMSSQEAQEIMKQTKPLDNLFNPNSDTDSSLEPCSSDETSDSHSEVDDEHEAMHDIEQTGPSKTTNSEVPEANEDSRRVATQGSEHDVDVNTSRGRTTLHWSSLTTEQEEGVLWLASCLCETSTKDDMDEEPDPNLHGNCKECTDSPVTFISGPSHSDIHSTQLGSGHPLSRWLASFDGRGVITMLYAFSTKFPALIGMFLDLLPPAGVYLLTNHFESVSNVSDNVEIENAHQLPAPDEIFQQVYNDVEDHKKIVEKFISGREMIGEAAFTNVLKTHVLIRA